MQKITITARGEEAQGQQAQFSVYADGQFIGHGTAGADFADYSFDTDLDPSVDHKIQVSFDNDYYNPAKGEDRNLVVKSLKVGDTVLSATDANVATTAGFDDQSRLPDGGRALWTNGDLTFNTPKALYAPPAADIAVSLRGEAAAGEQAHFSVYADGVKVGEGVASDHFETYKFNVPGFDASADHKIQVTFDNDYWNPGVADRNLIVNSVTVGDKTVFAADSHVVSTSGPSADGVSDVTADGGRELFSNSSLTFDTTHAGQNDGLGTPVAHDPAPVSDPAPAPQPEPTAPAFDPAPIRHGQPLAGWIDVTSYHHAGDPDDTAMFQRALADLHDGQTLYIPKGTYNISSTLEVQGKQNVHIYGEDPANTILNWTGKGGTVLDVDGVSGSTFSGFSIDGHDKADTLIWDRWGSDLEGKGTGGQYVTNNTWSDISLSHAKTGVLVGGDDSGPYGGSVSEQVFERVNFDHLGTGLQTDNSNALDIAVRNSHFADNGVGVSATTAGFHVYDSSFERSTSSDLFSTYGSVSAIGNTSTGSAVFLDTAFTGSPSHVTLQNNNIYDTTGGPDGWEPAIWLKQPANVVMEGNVFRGENGRVSDSYGVHNEDGSFSQSAVTSYNNTFTVKNPFETTGWTEGGRLTSTNDHTGVAASSIPTELKDFAFAKSVYGQPVFELGPDATVADVQHAIDAASAYTGLKPIIHFASGDYHFDSTISVPPGSDIVMQGQGSSTVFYWDGAPGGTMLHIQGPSNAEFDDIRVHNHRNPDGGQKLVVIDGIDNDASHVTINQATTYDSESNPTITIDHVDHAHVGINSAVFFGTVNVDGGAAPVIIRDAQLQTVHQTSGTHVVVADYYGEGRNLDKFSLEGDAHLSLFGGQQIATDPNSQWALAQDNPFVQYKNYTGTTDIIGFDLENSRITADNADAKGGHLNLVGDAEVASIGGISHSTLNSQKTAISNTLANTPGVDPNQLVRDTVGNLPDLTDKFYAPQPGGSNIVFNGFDIDAGAGLTIRGGDVGGAAAAYEAAHPAGSAASQMASYLAQSQSGQQANAAQTSHQVYTADGSVDPNALIASLMGTKMGMGDLTAAANTGAIMPAADQAAAAALAHAMDAYAATDTSAHHYHGDSADGHNTHHHVYDDMMV